MTLDWKTHAERLADEVAGPVSRWREPVATTPRHLLVPRWWDRAAGKDHWSLSDGPADGEAWMRAAYGDDTLITRVGPLHADHATRADRPDGRPTSSSTLPGLVVRMLRHLYLYQGAEVLDVGTGSGYSAALLAHRLGSDQVTSIDIDPYLTQVAVERLDRIGLNPRIVTCDATGPLPGSYDRIVSMVAVRPIPASWLAALRPGGRLVTTITGTMIVITATKNDDGWAIGGVEWDRAGFMETRGGTDYPSGWRERFAAARNREGEHVGRGRYPVINVTEALELSSVLEVTAPGIDTYYEDQDDGHHTAWLVHPDGSWARASAFKDEAPTVHQGGPRRLWDILDEIRHYWLTHGYLQLYGAKAFIKPDGTCHLIRGNWRATID